LPLGIRWLQFVGCSLQRVGREAPSLDPLNYRCAGMARGGMSSVVRLGLHGHAANGAAQRFPINKTEGQSEGAQIALSRCAVPRMGQGKFPSIPCASTLWRNSIAGVVGPAVRLLHWGHSPFNPSMRFVSAQFSAQTGRCRGSCQLKTSRQASQQLRHHFVAV
jgi:hypothetical protein